MSCPGNNACVSFGKSIQTEERSSADSSAFKSAKALFGYVNNTNAPPKFKSHTDYLRWKRIQSQLYSVTP